MIGQTVSHGRILEHRESGGMGVANKGRDTRLKCTGALRFLARNIENQAAAARVSCRNRGNSGSWARLLTAVFMLVVLAANRLCAQGFYVNREEQLPDTTINEPLRRLALPTAIYDARGAGMGRTRVADEKSPSSFRYNPGFLGMTDRFAVSGGIFARAPVQTGMAAYPGSERCIGPPPA
jgi:hypothetical protein